MYLAVVIDLYSRQVVGWSMARHMQAKLVLMEVKNRNPVAGLLWHGDRGSQYASASHRELLDKHGILQSMSRKGNCWDNAVLEIFFHTLQTELVNHEVTKIKMRLSNLYSKILMFFITVSGFIPVMIFCRP